MDLTIVRPDGNEAREILHMTTDEGPSADVAFDKPPPRRPQQQQHFQMPPPPQMPQAPPQPEELNDFANPNKIDDGSLLAESPEQEQHQHQQFDDDYGDNDFGFDQTPAAPEEIEPTPPFATLADERADLMFKLTRAGRNGIQVRSFGYNADIRDLRSEVARAKAEQDVTASIAFQRQILMTICSGLEFANRKFSYMDLELDGWSENMMDDIGKFDTVFEKLHAKHAGRISMPPEVQLILMIGGSAMTWHLTRTMMGVKSKAAAEEDEKKKKKSKRRRRYETSESESESDREVERRRYSRPKQRARKPSPPERQPREMKGPGFDVGGMMGLGGMMGSMMPQIPVPDLAPQFTRPVKRLKQSKPVLKELTPSPEIQEEEADDLDESEESERLSDIPSDLEDVPSDLEEEQQSLVDDARVISFEKPKGKRASRAKVAPKNVIVI